MLIGADYDKIEWSLFGLDLLEPNTFVGDVIILAVALYFAYRVSKMNAREKFFVYWRWFFLVFGVGFFFGGLGHLLYNYTGVAGKYAAWYSGIISTYFIEMAFISIFPNPTWVQRFKRIAFAKMLLVFAVATYVFYTTDLTTDHKAGLMVPTANATVGLMLTLVVLGFYYYKKIDKSFLIFFISFFIVAPSAIFQALKINVHQWFDRNDASHVFIIISAVFYYTGIKAYNERLQHTQMNGQP